MTLQPLTLWQLAYIACCLVGMAAIFVQQRYRYRNAKGCRWWLRAESQDRDIMNCFDRPVCSCSQSH